MTVNGSVYVARQWHPTLQPANQRDRWVQRGEVISMWEPVANVPVLENWPTWHWTTPGILRFQVQNVNLSQAAWLMAAWTTPHDPAAPVTVRNRVIAKRLWRMDIDMLLALEKTRLGRDFNLATDVLSFTPARAAAFLKRVADGGRLWNKASKDIALNDPTREGA